MMAKRSINKVLVATCDGSMVWQEVKVAKLLNQRELELFHTAVNYAVDLAVTLDNLRPNDGFEPARAMVAQRVAAALSFDIDEDDIAEVSQDVIGSR